MSVDNKIQELLNQFSIIQNESKQKTCLYNVIGENSGLLKRDPEFLVNAKEEGNSFMKSPQLQGEMSELDTPDWFRNTQKVDVSVIIPLYKSEEVIVDLINSWELDYGKLKVEMIFVDDCCPNNSKEVVLSTWEKRKKDLKFPVGKIIINKVNKGYGLACNSGAAFASGKYIIFLNADTRVTKNWIQPIIELFESDLKIGIVGNLHIKEGGEHDETIDSAGSEWMWGSSTSFVHIGRHCYQRKNINIPFTPENAPKEILEIGEREMVTGCCFAITSDLFKYIGGFNANYRIGYWEDAEICLNVRELGYKIVFQPKSVIYHKLGHTGSGSHKYCGHNRQYFMNKWVKSHRIDPLLFVGGRPDDEEPVKNILIKRSEARGDILVASGVCAALKKKYPNASISFCTLFPEVVQNNPYIDKVGEFATKNFDVFYNLDFCYELRPNINILTSYAELVGVKKEDCKVYIYPTFVNKKMPNEYIVMHTDKNFNWAGRDWGHDNFKALAKRLLDAGEKIVCVGRDEKIPCTVDMRGKTNISELAGIISKAKAFIGVDSLPMHIAQSFNIPGICFFGCISPDLRIYNKNMIGITAKIPCIGCHNRKLNPSVVNSTCELGTLDCVKKLSVDEMFKKVSKVLQKAKKKTYENNIIMG